MAAAQGCHSRKGGTEPSCGPSDEYREYAYRIGEIVRTEFSHLKGVAYLDHAGTTLYAQSQLRDVFRNLSTNLYGNPHSRNASSQLSTDIVDQVRYRVAHYFNTTTDEYSVVFTSGATAALKLLADTFVWNCEETDQETSKNDFRAHFHSPGHFLYLEDNHTSVLGIRAIANREGATVSCVSVKEATEFLTGTSENAIISWASDSEDDIPAVPTHNCLFAFPAQSNFCGRKYPLSWIQSVHNGDLDKCVQQRHIDRPARWSVLLDAAGLLGTSTLDLGVWQPEFVCVSFHKIFGLPTGLGALLVHRSARSLLRGKYFGGGTVTVAIAGDNFHAFRPSLEEKFEAGTVSFLDILSLQYGFDCLKRLTGTPWAITQHTFRLANYVHHRLNNCYHSNGQAVAVLYCHTDFEDVAVQGAIVNFNLLWSDGQYIGFAEVEKMAAVYDIHLRTGCMCNPGACQRYLCLTSDDLKHHFEAGHVCGDDKDLINGRPTGSIRVSFGYMSTWDDAQRLIHMIETCFQDKRSAVSGLSSDALSPEKIASWTGCGKEELSASTVVTSIPTDLVSRQELEETDVKDVDAREKNIQDKVEKNSVLGNGDSNTASRKPLTKASEVWDENDDAGVSFESDYNAEDKATKTDQPLSVQQPKTKPNVDLKMAMTMSSTNFCKCSDYQLKKCVGSHVCSISLFPVKSCGAFQVNRWPVGSRGFLYDREWMIVSRDYVSLTQKRVPQMCLIKPEIDLSNETLILHFKGNSSVNVPLIMDASIMEGISTTICQTKVCRDRVEGIDCGDEVADWLSAILDIEGCRLLRQSLTVARKSSKKRNTTMDVSSVSLLSLSNEAQYLLLNLESGRALAREIKSGLEANGMQQEAVNTANKDEINVDKLIARFRGNLIVDVTPSFAEERWQKVLIGSTKFMVEGPCNRCQMICINQDTGEKSKEPLLTLTACRGKRVHFGIYLSKAPEQYKESNEINVSVIEIGDPVIPAYQRMTKTAAK